MRGLLVFFALAFALTSCDRVRIDDVGPRLLSTFPDLTEVQTSPELDLELRPPPSDGALTLRLNDEVVPFDSTLQSFVYSTTLIRGVNRFLVELADATGEVQRDTLYALHLIPRNDPVLPQNEGIARVDAAIGLLSDGSAVFAGGTGPGNRALSNATIIEPSQTQFVRRDIGLQIARTGHTATSISRGFNRGVLLLGGTESRDPGGSFVSRGELVQIDGSTQVVEVEGGVERTGHTAFSVRFDGETYLYLHGGRIPSGSGAEVSGTVDVYRVNDPQEGDLSLTRLSPRGGSGAFDPITDHVQVPVSRTAVAYLGIGGDGAFANRFLWTLPGTGLFPYSLVDEPASRLRTTRTRAASAQFTSDLSLVLGGQDRDGRALGSIEVYAAEADRTFRFPGSVQLQVPRSDHVATILGTGRIMIGGGLSASGTALVALESISL
ncbi:MAG: hypothetical protein AAGK21_07465 [Bacteroidota bacterium]